MRIKIRVYNPYDLDIIALTEAPNFSVANAMKQTLKYYASGRKCLIEIPNLTEKLQNDQYVKAFYVELDDVKDAEAVKFIKAIPEGFRNTFMKNILRASFEVCPMSLYMGEGSAEYIAKMIANPRIGKCPVQREIIDPVYLAEGEIGVTVSDASPDISKLPHGKKASTIKKKSAKENLRELTQKAYDNATRKEEEKKQRQKAALEDKTNDDTEMDDLLDSIMG